MSRAEHIYEEFWKPIVENMDGSINKEQMIQELGEFKKVLDNVIYVYYIMTNGEYTNPLTDPELVIKAFVFKLEQEERAMKNRIAEDLAIQFLDSSCNHSDEYKKGSNDTLKKIINYLEGYHVQ